jgi:hypothetical protein
MIFKASNNVKADAKTAPPGYETLSPLELEGCLAELKRTEDKCVKDGMFQAWKSNRSLTDISQPLNARQNSRRRLKMERIIVCAFFHLWIEFHSHSTDLIVEDAKKNEIKDLREKLARLEGGKGLRETIHNGQQAESEFQTASLGVPNFDQFAVQTKILVLATVLNDTRKSYAAQRLQINGLLNPPRTKSSRAVPKRPAPKKRPRKAEEFDEDEVHEVQPPAKKVASGKKATVEDDFSDYDLV